MSKYIWSALNTQQVGAYAEYFVKIELTMHGFQVYGTEVDDRGIDFVARYENGPFIAVQVKSLRDSGYAFLLKDRFALREDLYLALVLLTEKKEPDLYLIPATAWLKTSPLLVDHDYEGLKSYPEYGVNVSKKNMPALQHYRFEKTVHGMRGVGQVEHLPETARGEAPPV